MAKMSERDEMFMSIALGCAARGRGAVEPNPMVGAVLVRDGEELARGWHKKFGGPHAEIDAIASARAGGIDPSGATMYVTLEPCCHHGKTPPCSEAIISAGISRVVIAMEDPDSKVAGRGVKALKSAGVEVAVGTCRTQAQRLLGAYVKLRTECLPWVICKWAQTADGYIALGANEGRWISTKASRDQVHSIRSWCDGILVGIDTVRADDPLLTNRSGAGKEPVRIVLDSHLGISTDCKLVRTAGEFPLLIATTRQGIDAEADKARELRRRGVELLELPDSPDGVELGALLEELGKRQWTYLLVEGGSKVLGSFISSRLADELLVFVCPPAPACDTSVLPRFDISEVVATEGSEGDFELLAETRFDEDRMLRYIRTRR